MYLLDITLGFDNSESLLGQITCKCVTINYCYGNNNNDNNNDNNNKKHNIGTQWALCGHVFICEI